MENIGKRIKDYMKAGEQALSEKQYALAYHCFGSASGLLGRVNLKLLSKKYMFMAGDAASQIGGTYYPQEAAFAYGRAGEKSKLEAYLKKLGYCEEEIIPSSWMAHARFLAEESSGGYEYGR